MCDSKQQAGFTLIELMVAMLLGLIVIAGVGSVFVANLQSYKANTALGGVQSNARIAFELITRDIRQAGLTGCNSRSGRIANILANSPGSSATWDWWANWNNTLRGRSDGEADPAVAFGSGVGARAAGTGSLMLLGAMSTSWSISSDDGSTFTMVSPSSDIREGDIIIACDPDHAVLLQASSYSAAGSVQIGHGTEHSVVPANCSAGLGYPTPFPCDGPVNTYVFEKNASVSKLNAVDWYIGNNPAVGKSLYRMTVVNQAGTATAQAQEMVRNVIDLSFLYHLSGSQEFLDAASIASNDWHAVDAIRTTLTMQSDDQTAGTNRQPIVRQFTSTTTIRNRVN